MGSFLLALSSWVVPDVFEVLGAKTVAQAGSAVLILLGIGIICYALARNVLWVEFGERIRVRRQSLKQGPGAVRGGPHLGFHQGLQFGLLLGRQCRAGVAGSPPTGHQSQQALLLLGREEPIGPPMLYDDQRPGSASSNWAVRASRAWPAVLPTAWTLPATARYWVVGDPGMSGMMATVVMVLPPASILHRERVAGRD
jgi:hypothetical protein